MSTNKVNKSQIFNEFDFNTDDSLSDDVDDVTLTINKYQADKNSHDVEVLDVSKLHVFHINALTENLAAYGFSKSEVMRAFHMMELQQSMGVKFPKEGDRERFAETVGELSKMSTEERKVYIQNISVKKNNYGVEYSSLLHHLGVKGIVFVDPENQLAYTASEGFSRFVCGGRGGVLRNVDFVINSMAQYLDSMSGLFSRLNSGMKKLMNPEVLKATGLEVFLSTPIDVSGIIGHKSIVAGTVKSTTPLPFIHPPTIGVETAQVLETVVSRAIQDICGFVPVSFSDNATCTQGIFNYVYPRYDQIKQIREDKEYVSPIKIADDGYNGDASTTDIFVNFLMSEGDDPKIPDDLVEYFSIAEDVVGNFSDPKRRAVDCVDNTVVTVDKKTKKELPSLVDHTSITYKFLCKMENDWKIRTLGGIGFGKMNYSKSLPALVADEIRVHIIDFASYGVIVKEYKELLNRYIFPIVSSFSQTLLAVPISMAKRTDVGKLLIENAKLSNTCVSDIDYPLLWVGISKKFTPISSATYASAVVMMHRDKSGVVDLNNLVDMVLSNFSNVSRGKVSGSQFGSDKLIRNLVKVIWNQESSDRGILLPFGAAKLGGQMAFSAMTALTENSVGFVDLDTVQEEVIEFHFDCSDEDEFSLKDSVRQSHKFVGKMLAKKKAERGKRQPPPPPPEENMDNSPGEGNPFDDESSAGGD